MCYLCAGNVTPPCEVTCAYEAVLMRAAAFFNHVNFDVLHRANVRAHLDDGRNFLLRTRTEYHYRRTSGD
jgi:hypothetical protein